MFSRTAVASLHPTGVKALRLHPARASQAWREPPCKNIPLCLVKRSSDVPYVMRRRTRPTVSHDLLDADSTLKNLKHRHSVRDCFFPPQRGLNFQDIRICFKVLGRKVKKKSIARFSHL